MVANDMEETERSVKENWTVYGGMILQYTHHYPSSVLEEVFSTVPEAVKAAFGHLSTAYGAIADRYTGKHLVFTPIYVFLSHSRDEKTALEEFLAFKKPEEGGILVRAGGLTTDPANIPYNPWSASTWRSAQGQQQSSPSRKVRRKHENDSGTAMLCSIKLCPTLEPLDFRQVKASHVLKDTGCETTTVYGANHNRVHQEKTRTCPRMAAWGACEACERADAT
jgi:hypothetical protein